MERMDPTLEESARIAGAGQWYVIRKITMPLVMPATAAGAMLILISSLSHFGVPAILGFSSNIFTLPTKIFQLINRSSGSFQGIREGAALSVLLVAVVVAALWLQKMVLKTGRYDIIKGKSMRPVLIKLRKAKYPLLLVSLVSLFVIVIMPLFMIFAVGGLKAYGLPLKLENMTLRNYKYVLTQSQMVIDSIKNSLFLSITAGIICMFLGVMIAYIARYVSFAMKSAAASLEQVHYSLEEAARSCGATHLGSLWDITISLIRPGMIAGFFLIFLPAMRELTTSILLYGPFTRTLGVAIYSVNAEGNTVQASALAAVAIVIIILGNGILRLITKERKGV